MDTTKKFDGLAEVYTTGRPGYAGELIDSLYTQYGLSEASVVADVGSGTGKFAERLLQRGTRVYCVEPNDDMRREAESALCSYSHFHSVRGNAEHTTLDAESVDFVTAAQAFHWFDGTKFRQECQRILKKGGKAFLIWNVRDRSDPVNQEMYRIYARRCPNFKGFSGGIEKDDPRITAFFDGRYEYLSFSNPLFFDREKFIARSLSGSYSLQEGDEGYADYLADILSVFDQYADHGMVSMGNHSVAYIGTMK